MTAAALQRGSERKYAAQRTQGPLRGACTFEARSTAVGKSAGGVASLESRRPDAEGAPGWTALRDEAESDESVSFSRKSAVSARTPARIDR